MPRRPLPDRFPGRLRMSRHPEVASVQLITEKCRDRPGRFRRRKHMSDETTIKDYFCRDNERMNERDSLLSVDNDADLSVVMFHLTKQLIVIWLNFSEGRRSSVVA